MDGSDIYKYMYVCMYVRRYVYVFGLKDEKPHLKFIDKYWDDVKKSTTDESVDANDGW